ncbi:MAG: ECF transporter S component, partial [Duncaniella sp.]|nr:ECF transporter S component [Duncaniella sp.]
AIMIKSTLLAIFASAAARRFMRADLLLLVGVVLAYQIVGTLAEWVIKADFMAACQDFRIGIPGMLLQIFGGWLLINYLARRD